jgi:hypothetical protein
VEALWCVELGFLRAGDGRIGLMDGQKELGR